VEQLCQFGSHDHGDAILAVHNQPYARSGVVFVVLLTVGSVSANQPVVPPSHVSEFILEGRKELLPPQPEDAAVVTSKQGPVRTHHGGPPRGEDVGLWNAPQPTTLRVASLTHISEGCVERR
jgi:hypothetical protein